MKNFPEEESEVVESYTKKIVFGCGTLYLTVNLYDGRPVRVFTRLGKIGLCQCALLEGVARLVTIVLQDTNMPLKRICHTLVGLTCAEGAFGKASCLDVIAKELKQYVQENGDEPQQSI